MKIIKRLSTSMNLPLMWTKLVGGMEQEGVDGNYNTDLYIDPENTSVDVKGCLNNIAKLYNITVQFDLLDHKTEDELQLSYGDAGYRRTFMDDIFPYIKLMKLNDDQTCTKSDRPAQYTGYWERNPLSLSARSQDYKERAYYLWSKFTFLPTDITGIYKQNGAPDADGNSAYNILAEKYGYVPSYFYQNAFQNAYDSRGAGASHGTDGYDEKNVTVAGSAGSDNQNESIPESASVLDRMLAILNRIINNAPMADPDGLTLNLLKFPKYYTKMTGDTILLDYSSDAKYRDADKKVIVKFEMVNSNNEDAVIRKISLVSDEDSTNGDAIDLQSGEAASTKIDKENVTYSNHTGSVRGYRIAHNNSLTCFVPVKLRDWQDGKKILKVDWTARVRDDSRSTPQFSEKKGSSYVYVGERELFNLE